MAELGQQEQLQPSLLDRLTDNEPESDAESRAQRVLSLSRLKRSVLRDLAALLNTGNLEITEDLENYPQVRKSVLNYGIMDLAGKTVSGMELAAIERKLHEAILEFEPRILAQGLRVRVKVDREKMSQKTMSFLIEGQLWAQPLPVSLYLSTDLDLETGNVSVTESAP